MNDFPSNEFVSVAVLVAVTCHVVASRIMPNAKKSWRILYSVNVVLFAYTDLHDLPSDAIVNGNVFALSTSHEVVPVLLLSPKDCSG